MRNKGWEELGEVSMFSFQCFIRIQRSGSAFIFRHYMLIAEGQKVHLEWLEVVSFRTTEILSGEIKEVNISSAKLHFRPVPGTPIKVLRVHNNEIIGRHLVKLACVIRNNRLSDSSFSTISFINKRTKWDDVIALCVIQWNGIGPYFVHIYQFSNTKDCC